MNHILDSTKAGLRLIRRNFSGWTTDRHLVVIESDDWGSIRTSSEESYNYLLEKGYPVDQCAFNRFDKIESDEDIMSLMNVLDRTKDSKGNSACMTLNYIMANPDFESIARDNFERYSYETVDKTYVHKADSKNVLSLVHKGMDMGVLKPQFHGREHVNVQSWMKALRNHDAQARDGFEQKMFTSSHGLKSDCRKEFLDTFGSLNTEEYAEIQGSITDGMNIFEKIFGFKSESVIAPCYIWDDEIERIWHRNGLEFIQSGVAQMIPNHNHDKYTIRKHFVGQKNNLGQLYLVRNVVFEPSTDTHLNWIEKCFQEIKWAFRLRKPAIISTHRLNYMGGLSNQNRENGLDQLDTLLSKVKRIYPSIEFLSSDQLGKIISS